MKTSDAILQILRCHVIIARNAAKAVNAAVRRFPWLCMAVVTMTSVTVSAAKMMQARAERDRAAKQVVLLKQQVNNLSCALEAREETGR